MMNRDSCPYAERYCEENVWQLIGHADLAVEDTHAIFVTNAKKRCALWCQRAALQPEEPIVWDYHVVLVQEAPDGAKVWDLDSTLGFPEPFRDYVMKTFLSALALPPEFHPRFRVVSGPDMKAGFFSDRSHMKKEDGTWHATPPEWPAITPEKPKVTLAQALDLAHPAAGPVLNLEALIKRFT